MLAQKSLVIGIACASTFALAQIKPITPGPGETYTSGASCIVAWEMDGTRKWKNVSIDLMSGSNMNMTLVTNVVSSIDGTDSSKTSYAWTCPEVDPYSAIYFYQCTNGDDVTNRTWTTRFTIASPRNETVPPEHAQQPDGSSVPWGTGHLIREDRTTHSHLQGGTIVLVDPSRIVTASNYIPSSASPRYNSGEFEGVGAGSMAGILPANATVMKPPETSQNSQTPNNTTDSNIPDLHGSSNLHSGAYRAFSTPRSWSVPFAVFSIILAMTSLT